MGHDVIVVGGGLIGGSVAYHLAVGGAKVLLLERGRPGREASWAGAGVLTDISAEPLDEPLARLCAESLAYYGEFVAALQDASGLDVGYRKSGMLRVALSTEETDRLERYGVWARSQQIRCETVTPAEALELEPKLSPNVLRGGVYLPDACQVHNPTLTRALIDDAAVKLGVEVQADVPVTNWLRDEAGTGAAAVRGVRAGNEAYSADTVVLAAGCWSGELAGGLGIDLPVEPVRGQIVLLESHSIRIEHMINSGSDYLVPREGGRILVGSTFEHAGFVKRNTVEGVAGLLRVATRLFPDLKSSAVVDMWSGLRPGNADGGPLIGPAATVSGLWIATGHATKGILLAPITGKLVAEGILSGRTPETLRPFAPERPATRATESKH